MLFITSEFGFLLFTSVVQRGQLLVKGNGASSMDKGERGWLMVLLLLNSSEVWVIDQ